MAPSRLWKAIETVKDQLSIGLAKVNNRASLHSDLNVAIFRATKHDEYPADERHISTILNLTCYSSPYVCSCVKTISSRLRKTKTWTVALKTLMLVHRLLHDGDAAFEKEFFLTPRYRTCLNDMCNFLDKTRLYSWDYSSFVRAYALYLNNQLEQKVKARKGKHGSVYTSRDDPKEKVKPGTMIVRVEPVHDMKMEQILTRIYCLMKTLELFLNCRPSGSAKTSRVVKMAISPVIKESFVLYNDITYMMDVLVGRFMELDIRESIKAHEILCIVSKQLDKLDAFYKWSISCKIVRDSEYPQVVKIPQMKLDVMEKYIRELQVEEQNVNSIKALPPPEGFAEQNERSEQKQIQMKIHEVCDLIRFDNDDSPTTEEHPDKLALGFFEGASTTEPSQWVVFNDSVDWEVELEQSVNNLSNQHQTSTTWGFDALILEYGKHQERAVNYKSGSTSNIGVQTMLALPAPPTQNDATTVYPNYGTPMAITLSPYVHMSEMEIRQRHPIEHHVMWQ